MVNLASAWESAGRSAEAINLLKTFVLKRQRVLGPTHPQTLRSSTIFLEWGAKYVSYYQGKLSLSSLRYKAGLSRELLGK